MEEFRNEMNHIHAPKDLIQQTKQMMHEENEKLILSREEVSEPAGRQPFLRNLLIFAAGAGLVYAAYAAVVRNSADTVIWQNFDSSSDPYYNRAENVNQITEEAFAESTEKDLTAYLSADTFDSVVYLEEDAGPEADMIFRAGSELYEVVFTTDKPLNTADKTSSVNGTEVSFMIDEASGLRRAVWQVKGGWLRAEGISSEAEFRAFTENMISLDQ